MSAPPFHDEHQVVARFSATSALNHGCRPLIKYLAKDFFKINRLQNFYSVGNIRA
jgi:hypothetical protein